MENNRSNRVGDENTSQLDEQNPLFSLVVDNNSQLGGNPESRAKAGKSPTKRERKNLFQKGESGNPGGRPKLTEEQKAEKFNLVQACRDYAPRAFETLMDLAQNAKQDSVRMNAANMLIERAYGKAVQPTDNVNRDGDKLDQLSAEEAYRIKLGERKTA